jgi:hypothetical protein
MIIALSKNSAFSIVVSIFDSSPESEKDSLLSDCECIVTFILTQIKYEKLFVLILICKIIRHHHVFAARGKIVMRQLWFSYGGSESRSSLHGEDLGTSDQVAISVGSLIAAAQLPPRLLERERQLSRRAPIPELCGHRLFSELLWILMRALRTVSLLSFLQRGER